MTAKLIYRKVSVDGNHIYECGNCHAIFVGASQFCKRCGAEFTPSYVNWMPEEAPDTVNVTRCWKCHYNTTDSFTDGDARYRGKVYCSKNCRWRVKNGYCDEGYEDGKIDG